MTNFTTRLLYNDTAVKGAATAPMVFTTLPERDWAGNETTMNSTYNNNNYWTTFGQKLWNTSSPTLLVSPSTWPRPTGSDKVIGITWALLFASAIFWNLVLVFTIAHPKARSFHKPAYIVICNKALADCWYSATFMLQLGPSIALQRPFIGGYGNYLIGSFETMGFFMMSANVVVIALNRFVAIVLPHHMKRIFTVRTSLILCVVCWLVGLGTAIPRMFHLDGCPLIINPTFYSWVLDFQDRYWCGFYDNFVMYFSVCAVVLCYSVAFARYTAASRGVGGAGSGGKASRKEVRLFVQCALVAGLYLIMCLVWTVIVIGGFFVKWVMLADWLLYAFNAHFDTLIYYGMNGQMRRQLFLNLGLNPNRVGVQGETTATGNQSNAAGAVNNSRTRLKGLGSAATGATDT